jgi:hypothetical protein
MPVEVKGLVEFRKQLRQLAPDLAKAMDKDVKRVLQPIVKDARAYLPQEISGLSNWTKGAKSAKLAKKELELRKGKFPLYNASRARAGVVATAKVSKPNRNGFAGVYMIENKSAVGAIYETAGRKNPWGQEWKPKSSSHKYSHSKNPRAGAHFVRSIATSGQMKGSGMMRGRVIYRAWSENQRYTVASIDGIVQKTMKTFANRINAASAFRKVA